MRDKRFLCPANAQLQILLIAYHFPPDAVIGAVRPYQFARNLPDHGIEPWVLTVNPEFAEKLDLSYQPEGVTQARIHRTNVTPSRMMRNRSTRIQSKGAIPSRVAQF